MTELDYSTFVARYKDGKLRFGMPSYRAREFFTNLGGETLILKIGEGLRVERFLIMLCTAVSWWAFLISLPLAIWAFHWWAVAAVPAAWIFRRRHLRGLPVGRQTLTFEIFALAVAVLGPPVVGWGARVHVWLMLLAFSLLTARLVYFLSSRMMVRLVLRSRKAYDFLSQYLEVLDYSEVGEKSA